MEQDFKPEEWVANRVLASLGGLEEPPMQGYVVAPNTISTAVNAFEGAYQAYQLFKTPVMGGNKLMSSTSQVKVPKAPGPPAGPGTALSGYPEVSSPCRPLIVPAGPRGHGVALTLTPFRAFETRGNVSLPIRRPGNSLTYSTQTHRNMGQPARHGADIETETFRALDPDASTNAKMGDLTANSGSKTLRSVDLQKWPCRRCLFVHQGGLCEVSCIGCGTKNANQHSLVCPFKDKKRAGGFVPSHIRPQIEMEGNDRTHSQLSKHHVSATAKLSLECQRRGFNPCFKYYTSGNKIKADLFIKDIIVSGNNIAYDSQRDARDAVATRGLEVVRQMYYQPRGLAGLAPAKKADGQSTLLSLSTESLNNTVPANAPAPSSTLPGFAAPQQERQAVGKENIQSHQAATNIKLPNPKKTEWDLKRELTHSQRNRTAEINLGNAMELPGNVEPKAIHGILERAIANAPGGITFILPANVSVEVAYAYGKAIGTISRNRSRSRSPARDNARADRDYRERESRRHDHGNPRNSMDEYRPHHSSSPRNLIDEYRPHHSSSPRKLIDEYRPHRLTPPPKSVDEYRHRLSPIEWYEGQRDARTGPAQNRF